MKINDAAELVEVSASTLRYWEKKLDLDVPRDELGSRTFNAEWVSFFKQVKVLLDEDLGWDEIGRRLHQPQVKPDEPPSVEPPAPPDEPEPPPAPVPIVDPELAAIKAEIAETQKKLDQAQRDLESQNKVITGLQVDHKTLQGSHDALVKLVAGLQEKITGLQAALEPLQGLQKRFWWVIGAIFVVFFFTMVGVLESYR